jgi:hypothetical protein
MPTFNPSPAVALGDKIVSDINAAAPWTPSGGSNLSFTARRVYWLAEYEPTDTDLHVDLLIALEDDEELSDKADTTERRFEVIIAVQKVIADKATNTECDALVAFANALLTFYKLETEFVVSGSQRAHCIERSMPVIYSPEDLDRSNRFFSVIRLKFEGWYA